MHIRLIYRLEGMEAMKTLEQLRTSISRYINGGTQYLFLNSAAKRGAHSYDFFLVRGYQSSPKSSTILL